MMLQKAFMLFAILAALQPCQALGATYEVEKYDLQVADAFKVPYSGGPAAEGLVTGFGSALTFKGYNDRGERQFYAVTDRGPNGDAPRYRKNGESKPAKFFFCPNFTPTIGLITLREGQAVVEKAITLKDGQGRELSGLPLEDSLVGSTGEVALSERLQKLPYDAQGLDTEGIAVDAEGNFWLADEYGPFIIKTDANGRILAKYGPGTGLPDVLRYRIPNRGFEGLTITPSGKVVASVQSVLDIEGETGESASFIRIVVLDPQTGEVQTYAYPIDIAAYGKASKCKLGDIFALSDEEFLIIEQGRVKGRGMVNKIYKLDISKAPNLSKLNYNGKPLEYAPAEALDASIYAGKEEILDLRDYGWTASKAEGVCQLADGTIAVINDNDFGIEAKIGNKVHQKKLDKYEYHPREQSFTLAGKKVDVQLVVERNSEVPQLWLFHKK